MRKEFEIRGCIEVTPDVDLDGFADEFLRWVESKGWYFGGGFCEITDGYHANPDGAREKPFSEE